MWVDLNWNPNSSRTGNQVHVGAWMGKLHVSWTTQWDESYIWFHASDMSGVNSQEMGQIRNTVVNAATGQANPGYWDIGYMVNNQTWADVLAKQNPNWNWINDKANGGIGSVWNDQNYNVDVISGNGVSASRF
jgi:hypothetical protein